MRVAIIGGGLFGCTAAIYAARAGHDVDLIEVKSDLMLGATASTFARLHRGYHYPRHAETGRESRRAEESFRAEYGEAVIDGGIQRYVVPHEGSLVSADAFRDYLEYEGLPAISFFKRSSASVFNVTEPRVNLDMLSVLVRDKVARAGVTLHLGYKPCRDIRNQFDRIVIATYSGLNDTLADIGSDAYRHAADYRYQVVEKIIARLPERFRRRSTVVIDGPFGCVDPLDDTDCHIVGHVTRTIHASNTGCHAFVPMHLRPLIDKGVITDTRCTRFDEVVDDLARWIPGLDEAVYVGSTFTVRAVLAHQEATDMRPTLVCPIDRQISTVFSGKLGTCVMAARNVCDFLRAKEREAA